MATSVGYLLDTNILVALIRGKELGERIDNLFKLRSGLSRCIISIVTVGECLSLAKKLNWGVKKVQDLKKLLDEVHWVDINHTDILDTYAEIDDASRKLGRTMGKNDVWIAATAKVTGSTVLTTDKDFDHLDGLLIDRIWIDPALESST
jgi:predicted nucleic acid-binding protein